MGIMLTFLRGLDDWLAREDPEVSAQVAADADYAEAMEAMAALGVSSDGDEADAAYHRLRAIEERNERQADLHAARSLIYRPL